jgi:hypothetical protein
VSEVKIEELFVVLAYGDDGVERIQAIETTPLIGPEETLPGARHFAPRIAQADNREVRIARFSVRTDVDVFQPPPQCTEPVGAPLTPAGIGATPPPQVVAIHAHSELGRQLAKALTEALGATGAPPKETIQ